MKTAILVLLSVAASAVMAVLSLLVYGGIFGVMAAGAWFVFKALT
jgi:hypothetical protein